MNKGIKSTKFWFSRSKFFFLRNVGFRLAQRIVFEIDCKNLILLVFWCRMPNYFLVDFALVSFIDFLTCVWFHHFSLLIWFVISVITLWETAEKFSLLLLDSYQQFGGVFYKKFSKRSSLYMDIYKPFCGGVFENFFIPLHYYWKVLSRLWGCF